MTESFYDLLGVSADADSEAIQRAYRQRMKETHPDLNDDPDASEQTARLVEARDVLTDDTRRARYDRLGHDAYVGTEGSVSNGEEGPSGTPAAADGARSGSPTDGPTNARASAEERRRRERRARSGVDFGHASTASGATGTASGSGDADTGGATTGVRDSGATSTPSWSDTREGWAARSSTSPPPGLTRQVLYALTEAPATALVTFVLYPLLVLGAFFPAFPLPVNLVVGACLLATIAASQSVPGMGIAVYGAWTVLGTVGLLVLGQHPLSPIGLLVLGTTWLPLGFSYLTSLVLDG